MSFRIVDGFIRKKGRPPWVLDGPDKFSPPKPAPKSRRARAKAEVARHQEKDSVRRRYGKKPAGTCE